MPLKSPAHECTGTCLIEHVTEEIKCLTIDKSNSRTYKENILNNFGNGKDKLIMIKLNYNYIRLELLSDYIPHYCVIRLLIIDVIRFPILSHCILINSNQLFLIN